MTDETALTQLIRLPGIGMWTAKMYLIFVLDRQNILSFEDVAFLQSYKWLYKTDNISKASIEQHFTTFTPPRKLMKLVYTRPELSPLDFLRFGP